MFRKAGKEEHSTSESVKRNVQPQETAYGTNASALVPVIGFRLVKPVQRVVNQFLALALTKANNETPRMLRVSQIRTLCDHPARRLP